MSAKILETENLTVDFDGFKALNQLNFSMDEGELRVVIGPNGAGKTTFLDAITGKVQPTQGRVKFKGRNLRSLSEERISRLGIGRKFQTPRVYLNLTPRENLEISCNRRKNVFATLIGRTPAAEHRTVAGLLETIGLTVKADIQSALLSHGEKQRLEIGMLVAQSPDLLLVDEPVAGLTDEETENVGNLLLALSESHSILAIEHDMEFVRQIARTVTVLHQGSVLCEGSIGEVQNDPKVIEVYLGRTPSISPHQLKLLRVVASMAWADGSVSQEETEVILSRFSKLFSTEVEEQEDLRQELRDYLAQDIPVEALIPEIENLEERELVLKLGYEVISSSSRSPNEPSINEEEAEAYKQLATLFNLPVDVVNRLEESETGGSA